MGTEERIADEGLNISERNRVRGIAAELGVSHEPLRMGTHFGSGQ